MRILHLDAGKAMQGGQWQVLRLIRGLAAEGVESTLLARPDAPLFEAAKREGWRVEPLGPLRAALRPRHDLIHAHDARGHTLALLARRPLVVSRRVAFPIRSRWKYALADRYIAVSDYVKSELVKAGVPASKIDVVYDGVPLLDPARGTEVLALAKDAADLLASVECHPVTNLERDLASARLFVYLTHSEGLGSGVLMAMSAGVPVVASKIGGIPEIIRHRENGLLVDNAPAAVAAAVRELLDRPDFARDLGAAARHTVLDRFSVERMVRRTMEVYRKVLA